MIRCAVVAVAEVKEECAPGAALLAVVAAVAVEPSAGARAAAVGMAVAEWAAAALVSACAALPSHMAT